MNTCRMPFIRCFVSLACPSRLVLTLSAPTFCLFLPAWCACLPTSCLPPSRAACLAAFACLCCLLAGCCRVTSDAILTRAETMPNFQGLVILSQCYFILCGVNCLLSMVSLFTCFLPSHLAQARARASAPSVRAMRDARGPRHGKADACKLRRDCRENGATMRGGRCA